MIGLALGSFVNSLVWRLKTKMPWLDRSRCTECKIEIQARHLVPVISWIMLDGACAECGKKISWQYPIVEFIAGVILMVTLARHFPFASWADIHAIVYESLFALTLLTLAVFDWRWKMLPIEFMAVATAFFGIWNAIATQSWVPLAYGVAFGVLFLGLQVLVSHGKWMGAGDPWIGALLGAGLGWPNVGIGMYLTYVLGGALVVVLLILGLVRRSQRIPFAPLLAVGGIGALWFGESIGLWFARALGWA